MNSANEQMSSRLEIEDHLLPEGERSLLGPACYKGFSFLVGVLAESDSWRPGPSPGQITFDYSPQMAALKGLSSSKEGYEPSDALFDQKLNQVEVILDVRQTLNWDLNIPRPHLAVTVSSPFTTRSTNVCILEERPEYDAGGQGPPITDVCASFVLWALSGFLEPTDTLLEGIATVIDSEAYEEYLLKRSQSDQRTRRFRIVLGRLLRERRMKFERELEIALARINHMSWEELAEEHRSSAMPSSRLEQELHEYRHSLLFPRESIEGI